jgi:hypothetical protein
MRRTPRFHNYDELLADAQALHANGYERQGTWSLGQVCRHLAGTMEKSLEGFPKSEPWYIRFVARTFVLPSILKHQQHKRRYPAPAYLVPPDGEDDRVGLEALKSAVARLKAHPGELQFHPVFGKMTRPQWQEFHLWHCENHFSYLLPKKGASAPA